MLSKKKTMPRRAFIKNSLEQSNQPRRKNTPGSSGKMPQAIGSGRENRGQLLRKY